MLLIACADGSKVVPTEQAQQVSRRLSPAVDWPCRVFWVASSADAATPADPAKVVPLTYPGHFLSVGGTCRLHIPASIRSRSVRLPILAREKPSARHRPVRSCASRHNGGGCWHRAGTVDLGTSNVASWYGLKTECRRSWSLWVARSGRAIAICLPSRAPSAASGSPHPRWRAVDDGWESPGATLMAMSKDGRSPRSSGLSTGATWKSASRRPTVHSPVRTSTSWRATQLVTAGARAPSVSSRLVSAVPDLARSTHPPQTSRLCWQGLLVSSGSRVDPRQSHPHGGAQPRLGTARVHARGAEVSATVKNTRGSDPNDLHARLRRLEDESAIHRLVMSHIPGGPR